MTKITTLLLTRYHEVHYRTGRVQHSGKKLERIVFDREKMIDSQGRAAISCLVD